MSLCPAAFFFVVALLISCLFLPSIQCRHFLILSQPFPGHLRPLVELVEELSHHVENHNLTLLCIPFSLESDERMKKWYTKRGPINPDDEKVHIAMLDDGKLRVKNMAEYDEVSQVGNGEISQAVRHIMLDIMKPFEEYVTSQLEVVEMDEQNRTFIRNFTSFGANSNSKNGSTHYLRIKNDPKQTLFEHVILDVALFQSQALDSAHHITCTKIHTFFGDKNPMHHPHILAAGRDNFTSFWKRLWLPVVGFELVRLVMDYMPTPKLLPYLEQSKMSCSHLVMSSYAFETISPSTLQLNTHFTGPFVNEKNLLSELDQIKKFDQDPTHPLYNILTWMDQQQSILLIVLGTTTKFDHPQLLHFIQAVHTTLVDTNVSIILSLSTTNMQLLDSEMTELLSHPTRLKLITGFIPQKAFLRMDKVHIFLTHCGANSVLEGLYEGKALIGMPYSFDHFLMSSLIEDAGCGISLFTSQQGKKQWQVKDLARAVNRILDPDGKYLQRARRIRLMMRHGGGVKRAAEIVEWMSDLRGDLEWIKVEDHLTWWQYWCLDIGAVVVGVVVMVMVVLWMLVGKVCCRVLSKRKLEKEE